MDTIFLWTLTRLLFMVMQFNINIINIYFYETLKEVTTRSLVFNGIYSIVVLL